MSKASTKQESWQNESIRLACSCDGMIPFRYTPSDDTLTFSYSLDGKTSCEQVLHHFIERSSIGTPLNRKNAVIFKSMLESIGEDGCGRFECCIGFPGALAMTTSVETVDPQRLAIVTEQRMRGICFSCAKADDGTIDHISGIAVDIQPHEGAASMPYASIEESAALLHALRIGSFLSVQFDLETGEHIPTDSDVVPKGIHEDITLSRLIGLLISNTRSYDGKWTFDDYNQPLDASDFDSDDMALPIISFDCQMASLDGSFVGTRWYGVAFRYLKNATLGHNVIFIHIKDINDKKTTEFALIKKAMRDPLTGLLNRTSFESFCKKRIRPVPETVASNNSIVYAGALIEIASFAKVNEIHGLPYGDMVLKTAAETIRALMHEHDFATHLSGAQFAILVREPRSAEVLKERIRILHVALTEDLNEDDGLSVNIGVAKYPQDARSLDELIKKADSALYTARKSKTGAWVFYTPSLDAENRLHSIVQAPPAAPASNPHAQIRTFGFFDVFVDDQPVVFHSAKAKELLALLVDRMGGFVTSKEAIGFLWEDEPADKVTLARYRKVAMRLKKSLATYGIEDIVESRNGSRRIVPEMVDCDLFNYSSGKSQYSSLFKGTYMNNYSWGENTLALLEQNRRQG